MENQLFQGQEFGNLGIPSPGICWECRNFIPEWLQLQSILIINNPKGSQNVVPALNSKGSPRIPEIPGAL